MLVAYYKKLECYIRNMSIHVLVDVYALYSHRMVKDLVMINDYSQIKQVVSALVHDFTLSSSANSRKGGLVGLAATAIALGRVSVYQ